MEMKLADGKYTVLHVDTNSLFWLRSPRENFHPDNAHNDQVDGKSEKHQSEIIAQSNRFIIDGNPAKCDKTRNSLRYYINFTQDLPTIYSKFRITPFLEYRDEGAYFYRKHFLHLREKHQNWFGIQSNGEAIAVSVARVFLPNSQTRDEYESNHTTEFPPNLPKRPLTNQSGSVQISGVKNLRGHFKAIHNDQWEDEKGTGPNQAHSGRCISKATAEMVSEVEMIPAWLVIVRREKGCDLRCCVVDLSPDNMHLRRGSSASSDTYLAELQRATTAEVKKSGQKPSGLIRNSGKKNQYAKTVVTMDPDTQAMLKFVTLGEINPEELRLGEAGTVVYDKLASMDELELLDQHKFGVLLCMANQSTESEMYNNVHSTRAFEMFLDLLGRRVTLKNYSGYVAGLDTKTNTTGLETYVSEFQGFPITFLVSTMLPFHEGANEQVGRKRHVGNSSVTFVFQEPDSLPFEADSILSRFQQVFIVIRLLKSNGPVPQYRIAVCQARGVPPFGPVICEGQVYEHGLELANLLLEKACNAANASLRSEKFQAMIQRSRVDYLRQFANEHLWSSPITRVDERKSSPFRALGRKRNTTAPISMYPVSDSDIQLAVTGEYPNEADSELRQSVLITGPSSASEPRKIRAKRLFREKTLDGSSQTRNAVNSAEDPSQTSSMRAPTVLSLHCSDFGHTFYVNLLDVHTLCGRLCVTQLFSRYLKPSKITDESDLDSRPIALTLSKQWFVATTIPFRASSKSKSVLEILLAIPTKSVFAYSFEPKRNMITLYADYGQYIRLLPPDHTEPTGDEGNVCHVICQFLSSVLPLGQLRQVNERVLKWTGDPQTTDVNKDNEVGLSNKIALAQQRRKSSTGKRCALTDLGMHISFTRIYADRDRESEAIRFPCLFKIDENSPAEKAGLYRGQILLRIGSHEMVDLFRAAMCISSTNDISHQMSNPFSIIRPPIRPEAHLAADLLNLIRQLRFSQDIMFAVGVNLLHSEDDGLSKLAHPSLYISSSALINKISFPYLRKPNVTFLDQNAPSRPTSRDFIPTVAKRKNITIGLTKQDEMSAHMPRRLSTGSGFGAEDSMSTMRNGITPPQSGQLQTHTTDMTAQQSWHFGSHKAPVSTQWRHTRRSELPSTITVDNMTGSHLQYNSQPVRWSFGVLSASDDWTELTDDTDSQSTTVLPRSAANWNRSAVSSSDEWLAEFAHTNEDVNELFTPLNGNHFDHVQPLLRHQKKISARERQDNQSRLLPLARIRGRPMISQSNPQLFSPTENIIPRLQSDTEARERLANGPKLKEAHNSIPKARSLKSQKNPVRAPLSPSLFGSDRSSTISPLTVDRRSRLEKENTKSPIWFPMQITTLNQVGHQTKDKTSETRPQALPRTIQRNSGNDKAVIRKDKSNSTVVLNREAIEGSDDSHVKIKTANRHKSSGDQSKMERRSHQRPPVGPYDQLEFNSNSSNVLSLRLRVQQLEKQLQMEQKRRSQMVTMCASLLEENKQLRFGSTDSSENRKVIPYLQRSSVSSPTDTCQHKTSTQTRTVQSSARGKVNFLPKFDSETDI